MQKAKGKTKNGMGNANVFRNSSFPFSLPRYFSSSRAFAISRFRYFALSRFGKNLPRKPRFETLGMVVENDPQISLILQMMDAGVLAATGRSLLRDRRSLGVGGYDPS
jgi:hypothetical protein